VRFALSLANGMMGCVLVVESVSRLMLDPAGVVMKAFSSE
jgi:hypothetical protein